MSNSKPPCHCQGCEISRSVNLRAQRFAEYGDTTVHLQLAISPVAWLMAALLLLTALVHALFVFSPPIPVAHGETTP